jgi:succinate dehydrogenase hydrophobic anchor subunit
MPDENHVLMNTTINNIANMAAWTTVYWKLMGSLLVSFAVSHGLHGVLSVEEDYLKNPTLRKILRYVVLVLTVIGIVIAIDVIWTR